jgi:hypothetical protein
MTTATATTTQRLPYKVKALDLLAEGQREAAEDLVRLGRKEIELAEHEMPGLMALRQVRGKIKPLKGRRSRARCT